MTTTSPDIAERLARRGRVRNLAPGATLEDIVARMPKARAAGLLHDGAGWEAQRIADVMGTTVAQVRRHVFTARLDAAEVRCTPCSDQVDGLMTFAADATDHAMECEECAVTREALRTGKGRIRHQWRTEEIRPVRPWQDARRTARPSTPPRQAAHRATASTTGPAAARGADAVIPVVSGPLPTPSIRRDQPAAPPPPRHRPVAVQPAPPSPESGPLPPSASRPARVLPIPNRSVDREATPAPATPRRRRLRVPRFPVTALATSSLAIAMVAAAAVAGAGQGDPPQAPPASEAPGVDTRTAGTPVADAPPADTTADSTRSPGGGRLRSQLLDTQPVDRPAASRPPAARRVSASGPLRTPSLPAGPGMGGSPREPVGGARPAPPPAPEDAPAAATVVAPPPPEPEPPIPSAQTWERLAACESSGDWALDTGNGFYGGLQFTLQSWRAVGGTGLPSDAPKGEQIARAEALWQIQGWGAWPSCSSQLGLR